jgi:hypothetical protein
MLQIEQQDSSNNNLIVKPDGKKSVQETRPDSQALIKINVA